MLPREPLKMYLTLIHTHSRELRWLLVLVLEFDFALLLLWFFSGPDL